MDIYRENKELNNDKVASIMRTSKEELQSSVPTNVEEKKKQEEEIDIQKVPEYIENLNYTFNSIKIGYPDAMNEEKYKEILSDLSNNFTKVTKALPLLKTEEELKKQQNQFLLLPVLFKVQMILFLMITFLMMIWNGKMNLLCNKKIKSYNFMA